MILLSNVQRGFDIDRSDIIDNTYQARVCQRPLPVTNKPINIFVTAVRNNDHPGIHPRPGKAGIAVYSFTGGQLSDNVIKIVIKDMANGQRQLATHPSEHHRHHAHQRQPLPSATHRPPKRRHHQQHQLLKRQKTRSLPKIKTRSLQQIETWASVFDNVLITIIIIIIAKFIIVSEIYRALQQLLVQQQLIKQRILQQTLPHTAEAITAAATARPLTAISVSIAAFVS